MPRRKAPGADRITVELLQACGPTLHILIAIRLSPILPNIRPGEPPSCHAAASVQDFHALHPDSHPENAGRTSSGRQAEFRRKFSALDHIITCSRLIEAGREHQKLLVLTLVGYKKAFDPVKPAKFWKALEEHGVEVQYTKVLSECYSGFTAVFRLFVSDIGVSMEKEVRQGEPVSLTLFRACWSRSFAVATGALFQFSGCL
ncbi:hypothetical protein ANCDUO_11881 [Ancylostoma duodenale]|uniref:Uncharacterized protein n=1 Tax=Ancylostoma duodenale TaxID=51022 RepID=A0A0C2CMS5_9BILA|nr:hypothetical protein ANCDUO_11881 [Ancylostoma duodenale]